MNLIETIQKLFSNNKKNPQIIVEDLTKIYGTENQLEIGLYCDKQPLPARPVIININGVEYTKTTDGNGICKLNINLNPGTYNVLIKFNGDDKYNKTTGSCKVTVNPVMHTTDLEMYEHDGSSFKAKITDYHNTPVKGTTVIFNINGVSYNKITGDDGVASLKINLKQGTYTIKTTCVSIVMNNTIQVKKVKKDTRMEGTDINKTVSEKATYQCAVYDNNGRIAVPVEITVNGVTYVRTPDNEGLCKLNINLQAGDYKITSKFNGNEDYNPSSVTNNIHITPDKKTYSKHGYHYGSGCGRLGQCTAYDCGPHALMQSYYNLTGIDVSEKTLMEVCGTTTNGTGHSGLETGLAWLNRKYGTNISIEWKNFSDLGWDGLKKILDSNDTTIFWHELYRNQWGHYSLADKIYSDILNVLNSLGSRCNYPSYCGYQELRSKSTQESYWNGISQKSIAILKNKG